MVDLEVWLIGTPDQVTAAMTALANTGRLAAASRPEALYGADAGRTRRYLRVSTFTTAARQPAARSDGGQQSIDLAA